MSTEIGIDRLRELLARGAQLVEVLPAEEFAKAHLPAAINLPLGNLHDQEVSALDPRRAVVVYCWDSL